MGSCPDTDVDPMYVYHENEIDTLKDLIHMTLALNIPK